MTNTKTFTKCLKLSWIRRWWRQNSSWTLFSDQYFGGIRDNLKVGEKYMAELASSTDSPFWKDVILAYHDFLKGLLDDNNTEISEQPLWYNNNIKLDLIQNWHNNGVSLISDLISPDRMFYKYQELKDIYKIKDTFLGYYRVMTAIPKSWKKKIELPEPKMIGLIKPVILETLTRAKRDCSIFLKLFESKIEYYNKKRTLNGKWILGMRLMMKLGRKF
ncbi:hypothetical protein SNE40_013046 [Patella caerulea]|uniref:Uncharacterized protein n=1 Tax=Patella caerulea TaxID=87958 RepID=A0AAN8JQP9_PATCE